MPGSPTGAAPPPCADPIFVVGPPRSGAGVLQWALRLHSELAGAEQTDFLTDLLEALRASYRHGTIAREQWLEGLGVGWEEFAAAAGTGINALITSRAGGRRWIDQTDHYVHDLAGIADLFPGAVYLVTQRDGRAAVAAMRWAAAIPHADACRAWRAATEAAAAWLAASDGRAHAVPYEELVGHPRPTLDAVFRFLGLPAEAASAAYVAGRTPRPPSTRPPAWHEWDAAERRTFHDIAGDVLIEQGYAADDGWVTAEIVGEAL
jgi:hypothetical protein